MFVGLTDGWRLASFELLKVLGGGMLLVVCPRGIGLQSIGKRLVGYIFNQQSSFQLNSRSHIHTMKLENC